MDRIVSATEARVHFGDIMKKAKNGPVFVERDGKPEAVIISKQEYDRLIKNCPGPDWRKKLAETHDLIRKELKGRKLPDPSEMLRQARQERDDEILNSLR